MHFNLQAVGKLNHFKSLNYCILHLNGYRPMHMHLDLLLGDRLHVFGSYTLWRSSKKSLGISLLVLHEIYDACNVTFVKESLQKSNKIKNAVCAS